MFNYQILVNLRFSRNKKKIFKFINLIYEFFKLLLIFLKPFPHKLKNKLKKLRRFRLTSFIFLLIFSLILIFVFNIIYPLKYIENEVAINRRYEIINNEFTENIENNVEKFRKEIFEESLFDENYKKWEKPLPSYFTFEIQDVTRIDEQRSTIRIKGIISAQYYPESIRTPYLTDGEIIKKAKNDILSIADLNFASTEERRFEKIAELNIEEDGYRRSKYRFEGEFPLERDLRKFPFDKAKWRIRLTLPINASAIDPQLEDGSFEYNRSFINAYVGSYAKCYGGRYIACLTNELISNNTYSPEAYFDETHENFNLAKLDFNHVIGVFGQIERSIPSSFARYILPIIFSLLVLSLTDQLSSEESWEIKIAIPPTVLLTLIFMQNTYHSQIPQLAYLTWLDKLYLIAYLSSILMLINAVISKGDWFSSDLVDNYAKLKLNYLIRNFFIFIIIVLPILLLLI